MLAENVLGGKSISHYEDPNAMGCTRYVADGDISQHLVNVLNRMAESSDRVTARHISSFLNEVLRRYYSTARWPIPEEIDECGSAGEAELGETGNESGVHDLIYPEMNSMSESEEEASLPSYSEVSDDESESDEESDSSSTSWWEPKEPLKKTEPAALDKYYLVKGSLLVELFQFCPKCGNKVEEPQLTAVGTAAIVKYLCKKCARIEARVQRWESQERTVPHRNERTHKGNVTAVVAALTTGLRYSELQRWAEELNLALFSRSFFYKIFNWTKPSIDNVYRSHQRFVLDYVRHHNRSVGALNLAADGAYDSRGFCANIGTVVVADTSTNLVLHTEVLHRSETGGVSARMEKEGLRRALRWIKSIGFSIGSVTTDRSKALGVVLRDLEPEMGAIRQYYDGWHLAKWLGNELRKVSKERDCDLIKMWIDELKSHLWYSMDKGAKRELWIPHIFNTCLMHVRNVHEWEEDETTGPYLKCGHKPLEGPCPEALTLESRAYQRLRDVILTRSFQRDLAMASPFGGTSICESKNALVRIYCEKERYYPISTYPYYAKMCTMHMNTLRLAEDSGERTAVYTYEVQRKYMMRKSKQTLKSQPKHAWRGFILRDVLMQRYLKLNDGSSQGGEDLFDDLELEL